MIRRRSRSRTRSRSRPTGTTRSSHMCGRVDGERPRHGMVVYANDLSSGRFGQQTPKVEQGAAVRQYQAIIRLPDLSKMQVKVLVHESKIEQLRRGQRARIKIQDREWQGTVTAVASQPEAANFFGGGAKEYATYVRIDGAAEGLKPGMTSDVTILIDEASFNAEDAAANITVKPVKLPKLSGVSLGTALRMLLDPIGATYAVRRDYIDIIPVSKALTDKVIRVFPVADLTVPIPNAVNPLGLNQNLTVFGASSLLLSSSVGTFGSGGGGGVLRKVDRMYLPRNTGDVLVATDVSDSTLPWPSRPRRFGSVNFTSRNLLP